MSLPYVVLVLHTLLPNLLPTPAGTASAVAAPRGPAEATAAPLTSGAPSAILVAGLQFPWGNAGGAECVTAALATGRKFGVFSRWRSWPRWECLAGGWVLTLWRAGRSGVVWGNAGEEEGRGEGKRNMVVPCRGREAGWSFRPPLLSAGL